MKTAVIYARYSSDNQTEQSIEGQLRVCEQYAKNNDILILNTYMPSSTTTTDIPPCKAPPFSLSCPLHFTFSDNPQNPLKFCLME